MFIVLLKFAAADPSGRRAHMEGHKSWLARGFDEGVFLLAGSLRPDGGGALVAHGASRDELELRLSRDPFVAEGIVEAEILEIGVSRTDARLAFLGG